jgi:diguanylate cyclase (GGDEF)-like protein
MERYQLPLQEKNMLERLRQPFAIYQFVDKRVATLVLSDGFCKLFGYDDRAQAYFDMDNNMYRDTHPDDAARIANAALRFATKGGQYEVVYRSKMKDTSDYRIIHSYGEHVLTDDGVRLAHVWYSDEGVYREGRAQQGIELTESLSNALHENSMVKANQYDNLTGLPSMSYFFELAEAGRDKVRDNGGTPVLMYIDFSGMKFFNTKYGFLEGDKLLRAFARILADKFGNEHCCRIGADHFAVQTEKDGLEDKLQKLLIECREVNDGKNLPVHIGVYVAEGEKVHASVACDRAKMACTALSGRYETAVKYYSQNLSEDAGKRQYIIENIDRAIKEEWIQIYTQPIIRAVNERVCDVEALARWVDPVKGVLSPADFIPALEDAGLIYKLDLYMVDQVLNAIKAREESGFRAVPHSINLSRSDFDSCDIVEEIRKRVDGAGVNRSLITIEITESVIGSDMQFMKEQVERFRSLGFPVWMDDFGSGYSSMGVLQSIRFDLIKFDMSFMRKLNDGEAGKIILTELMKMATSLGLDTVCEGVETEEQVQFLREIGCSKLQGYYYSKPIPFKTALELYKQQTVAPDENPEELDYYETIGRVNLFDLGVIASEDETAFHNVFETIPIAVLEVRDGKARYIRSNRSYQDFVKRFFDVNILKTRNSYRESAAEYGTTFTAVIRQCCNNENRAFFDEKMPDGSVVHAFARRISTNPVTGSVAIALAVLSISDPDERETYADIAQALATDYYNIFVIDLDTDDYIEYSSMAGGEELSVVRHGGDFFESARRDTMTRIYEEDREPFLALFTKERVLGDIEKQGVFTTTYRLIDTGSPMYVNMKITRMHGGNRIILGVSNIDAQMKQQEEARRLRQEKVALGRIAALSPDYIVLYTVDPETGRYTQYNPSKGFADFGLATYGEDFFTDVVLDAPKAIPSEDIERHLHILTKENMLREIRENGFFIYHYRLKMDGKTVPVNLRATMVSGTDGDRLILGVANDEAEYRRKLEEAQKIGALNQTITSLLDSIPGMAFTKDAQTGVYLACNQAFAEYAHKATPDGVVGLTDAEIFDTETAEHFVEDDHATLLMDKPYIFFEDVPDAAGNQRQFWTTKLKYIDASGRLCLQGFCQDVTDILRLQRENTRAKEDFQKASDTAAIYARLQAITGNFIVVYDVDPQTSRYREFSSTDDYMENFGTAKEGQDFFSSVRKDACIYAHPQDLNRFLAAFTKENVLAEIERSGIFTWGYRIMMDGKPLHVQMIAAMVEEKEGLRLIVGLNDIDKQVRQEEELESRLVQAQSQANIDALTGVKNMHAYKEMEAQLDRQITNHRQTSFAIVIFDVNDLKKVNDTSGHHAGDQYLRDACRIICDIFKHSPVFRVGGDEFAVITQERDYACIDELLEKVNKHNAEAARTSGIIVACGMAKYENDPCVVSVFERADKEMYKNKCALKKGKSWECLCSTDKTTEAP